MNTVDIILDAASERFNVARNSIGPTSDLFNSLGIDSLDALKLLTELEDRFDVEIPDYELRNVSTFQTLADLVDRRR